LILKQSLQRRFVSFERQGAAAVMQMQEMRKAEGSK